MDGVIRRLDSEIGALIKNYGHFHRPSLGRRLPLLTQETGGAQSGRFSKVVPHWQREGSWHFFTLGPGCVLGDTSCKDMASGIAELVNMADSSPTLREFSAARTWLVNCFTTICSKLRDLHISAHHTFAKNISH